MDINQISMAKQYNLDELGMDNKNTKIIYVDQKPDSFKKTNITAGGLVTAGAAATATGIGVYNGAKFFIEKGLNNAETECKHFLDEIGKEFAGFPNKVKTIGKYGGALLAALIAGLFVFKDSDKDGKLDILEAVGKFVNPD